MSFDRSRDSMPEETKWRLEDIFESSDAWEKEFKELSLLIPEINGLREGLLTSADSLLSGLRLIDDASLKAERLFVFARMGRDQDNADPLFQSLTERIASLLTELSSALSWFEPLILSCPEEKIREYLDTKEELGIYRHNIEDIIRSKPHVLSEKEERLLSMAGDFADGAETVFTMLNNADMRFPSFIDSSGKEEELSHARYLNIMRNRDRETRKTAYETYYGEYKKFTNTITAAYSTSVKKDIFYARARGFDSSLESALFKDNIPVSVYDGLIDAVHENISTLHRYMGLRKKLLGVDKLNMYDIYVPLVSDVKEEYTYEKAKKTVIEGLAPLGKDYVETVKEAFSSHWIDVYENTGKTSGAYSWGVYGVHPYMLLNHSDDLESMFTVAHEMGHSMHTYYSNMNQPYATAGYSIFVAEIASTVNEILLTKYLLNRTSDRKMRAYLLNHFIDQIRTTVIRQTMFAEFEKIVHEMAEKGEPLTSSALCDIYGKLNSSYHGPHMEPDNTISYEWSRIPHFYGAFYVYKYATGFSCAAAIVRRIENGGLEDYRRFLSAGGSDYPLEILKIAGIDLKQAISECMAEFGAAVSELEELLLG
jgi:oligoendopeptidase F